MTHYEPQGTYIPLGRLNTTHPSYLCFHSNIYQHKTINPNIHIYL